MTTEILRPNSSVDYAGTVAITGAASWSAATNDDSDSSYVSLTNGFFEVGFGTFTLPAGARTKTVTPRWRAQYATSSVGLAVNVYTSNGSTLVVSDGARLTGSFVTRTGPAAAGALTQAELDDLTIRVLNVDPDAARIAELYLDVVYATVPTVSVAAPSGTVSLTTSPTVSWSHTAGDDGGSQTHYQVKVFTAAQVVVAGFNPSTATPLFDTGEVIGSGSSVAAGPLPVGVDLWAYVRTAQTINGTPHWSAWDSSAFDLDVGLPVLDTLTAVGEPAQARVRLEAVIEVGSDPYDYLQVERSVDAGSTWSPIRGGALALVSGASDDVVLFDYEAPNGVPVIYRARPATATLVGDWVQSSSTSWASNDVWLKDPENPLLNTTVRVKALPEPTFPIRQGVHEVLGARYPTIVSDVRGGQRGEFTVQTDNAAQAAAVEALLGSRVVLLQLPAGWEDPASLYFVPGDVRRARLTAKVAGAAARKRRFTVQYIQVARPVSAVAYFTPLVTWETLDGAGVTWGDLVGLGFSWADLLVEASELDLTP